MGAGDIVGRWKPRRCQHGVQRRWERKGKRKIRKSRKRANATEMDLEAQCQRNRSEGAIRQRWTERAHSATIADRSGTLRGIAQRERKEEEKEIGRVAKRGTATTAERRDI